MKGKQRKYKGNARENAKGSSRKQRKYRFSKDINGNAKEIQRKFEGNPKETRRKPK